MASINVFIRKNKKKNLSPVVIEYSHLKKRFRETTKILVDPENVCVTWDDDLQRFKLTARNRPYTHQRESLLKQNELLEIGRQKFIASLESLHSRSIAPQARFLKHEHKKNEAAKIRKTIEEWYSQFISRKEHEMGAGINGYRSTFEHFKKFNAKKGAMFFTDLTSTWLEQFRRYLAELGLGGPTIHKQFRNLKIFLNWVGEEDETVAIPVAIRKIKLKARYGDPIGLTIEQFLEFRNVDLKHRAQLEITRDLFVFAVSIGGPRHSDLQRLAEMLRKYGFSIDQNTLTYFESKTGNAHPEILLNKFGIEVLNKYGNSLPHVPSNFRMNSNLKSIAKILNWSEIKFVPKYDNFGKLLRIEEIPLHEIFSTKFMRKTAATIDNYLGVATKTSMKRTGHKTFSAYSRYVDVNKESMTVANRQWDDLFFEQDLMSYVDCVISEEICVA